MLRVLEEYEHVSAGFSPDAVHDLRVSLRRCRSLADGLMALDGNPDWKAMKKAGKRLFQRLGELRDIHVMEEWVETLERTILERTILHRTNLDGIIEDRIIEDRTIGEPGKALPANPDGQTTLDSLEQKKGEQDPAAKALLQILSTCKEEQKHEAGTALQEFDVKQWRRWSRSLPARAARFRLGSALYKHLALERWTEARKLHSRALRNRSQVALHSLRIGIKRFRYVVENFLPAEHKAWGSDLKEAQDLLGEVHDLDVLWSRAITCHIFQNNDSRRRWHEHILAERGKRIGAYSAKMTGADSRWSVWRRSLPQGKHIQELATRRMKLWASGLDPDFPHSEHVAGLALQLYDGLAAWAWQPTIDTASARSSLLAAALLHDVGRSKGEKGHHKTSSNLIGEHGTPLGWEPSDLQRAAIIARFHRGTLPTTRHKSLRNLLPNDQKATIQLAAILRLANAFDACHDGRIRRLHIESDSVSRKRPAGFLRKRAAVGPNIPLVIAAEGYTSTGPMAPILAAERHLLETVLRRPVMIKASRRTPKP